MRKHEFVTEGPMDFFKNYGLKRQFSKSQKERDKKVDALSKTALRNVAAYIASSKSSGKQPTPDDLVVWAKKYFSNFSRDMVGNFDVNSKPTKLDERGLYDWFSLLINHNLVRLDTIQQQKAQEQGVSPEQGQENGEDQTAQDQQVKPKRQVRPKYEAIFSDPQKLRDAWNAFVGSDGKVSPKLRGVLNDIWMSTGGIKAESVEHVDEDWKKTAAAFGTGAALALGSHMMKQTAPSDAEWNPPPDKVVQNKKDIKPPIPPAKKEILEPLPKNAFRDILIRKATEQGIGGIELAQLLAQADHETGGYITMVEDGDFSRFMQKYDKTKSPRTAKILGNTKKGDGPKFRGRGHLQITGRDNYSFAARALNLPLTSNPSLLADPEIGADASLWYWNARVKPHVADFSDTESVTRRINPNLNGLQDRLEKFELYRKYFK